MRTKLEDHKIVLKTKLDEIAKAKNPDETNAALQKIVENLKTEIAQLKKERPPLGKQLAALQEELRKRKEPPKVVESVIIRPGGIGSREARNLFFVECTSTGIILQSAGAPSPPISTATIETNEKYHNLLKKVKRTQKVVKFLENLQPATPEEVEQSKKLLKEIAKKKGSEFSKTAVSLMGNIRAVVLFHVNPDSFNAYLKGRRLLDKARIPAGWEVWGGTSWRLRIPDVEVKRLVEPPPPPPTPPAAKPKRPPPISPKLD